MRIPQNEIRAYQRGWNDAMRGLPLDCSDKFYRLGYREAGGRYPFQVH